MTDTVLSSATREAVIGFGRPFVMIGERINPTGRKLLAEEMKAGNFSRVEADAIAQVEAGAHMLDVNAGIPLADEPALLAKAVQLVQSLTDVPLSIDSSIIEALEAGLAVYQGKPLVNSVTGEEAVLERVLPLIAKYGAAVVAISNDETGISMDPDVRFGKPCLTGTRIDIPTVVGALAAGESADTVAAEYSLTLDQIRTALAYAAHVAAHQPPAVRQAS